MCKKHIYVYFLINLKSSGEVEGVAERCLRSAKCKPKEIKVVRYMLNY